MKHQTLGIRRFCMSRDDRRCFELFNLKTGECASFPGTKRELERYLRTLQAEADAADVMQEQHDNYNQMIGESLNVR